MLRAFGLLGLLSAVFATACTLTQPLGGLSGGFEDARADTADAAVEDGQDRGDGGAIEADLGPSEADLGPSDIARADLGARDAAIPDAAPRDSGARDAEPSPHCTNDVADEDETDVDCGGASCPRCAVRARCAGGEDCASRVCRSGRCYGVCNNGARDEHEGETDVDCGGELCPPCRAGKRCSAERDCSTGDCNTGTCRCPANMIAVPVEADRTFCISRTEVTRSAYATFLEWAARESPSRPLICRGDATLTPTGWVAPVEGTFNLPVVNVDWCDALAYCESIGARLCGGLDGESVPQPMFANAAADAWFNACSAGGARVYPYAGTYQSHACNGADYGTGATIHVATASGCQGGSLELFDMSGNVAEWEDACDESNVCLVRGGSFSSASESLQCAADRTLARSGRAADVGIRCCSGF